MPVLALDTATLVSSVALAAEDILLAEITLQTKKTHSEVLMPHIEQLLTMANVAKRDIMAVAVSIGPGSFTGLRIGLATAKALAYALQIPIVGVPTLAALAYGCPLPGTLLSPLLDAQKGNVYQAVFRWEQGNLQTVQPARVIRFSDVLREMGSKDQPVLLLGEGAVMNRQVILQAGGNLLLAPPHIIMPRAASVAMLGQKMLAAGEQQDVMALEPLYIRRSEAEVLWEKRHGVCL
ncbi:MAG: tRNA (adenosine(37)-N6)-threonylcarbamoyltransferase complex dimerization subunit type 1 TsaB [Veillonellales bacterium]